MAVLTRVLEVELPLAEADEIQLPPSRLVSKTSAVAISPPTGVLVAKPPPRAVVFFGHGGVVAMRIVFAGPVTAASSERCFTLPTFAQ